jgi:coenzyme F420-0:L-glutamate ligase/coenzyme F420-1:gamma-L-glutamate ligase
VAVVVSDTAGRPWRQGQTDIAIGVAGLVPLQDHSGQQDAYGNDLVVTAPAVADEIAGAAELVSTKLGGRPLTVVRGLARHVLPPGEHGDGARALLRPAAEDMFGLGTREAVEAALRGDSEAFGAPAEAADFVAALARCGFDAVAHDDDVVLADAADAVGAAPLAVAHGWRRVDGSSRFQRSL